MHSRSTSRATSRSRSPRSSSLISHIAICGDRPTISSIARIDEAKDAASSRAPVASASKCSARSSASRRRPMSFSRSTVAAATKSSESGSRGDTSDDATTHGGRSYKHQLLNVALIARLNDLLPNMESAVCSAEHVTEIWTLAVERRCLGSSEHRFELALLSGSYDPRQRAATRSATADLHGKEGVDGSSPSEGFLGFPGISSLAAQVHQGAVRTRCEPTSRARA